MNFKENCSRIIFDILIFIIAVSFIILFRESLFRVIKPFLYALVLAYLFEPIVQFLQKSGFKRIYAVIIVFVCVIIILVGLLVVFIPRVTQEISVFIREIPSLFRDIQNYIENFRTREITIIPEAVYDFIDIDQELNRITEIMRGSFNQIYSFLLTSTGTILNIFLSLFIGFYYLKDKKLFFDSFLRKIHHRHRMEIKNMIADVDRVIGGYIKGQLIVALFVGFLTGLGSRIIGIPYSLTIGLVAGLTNIVPYFGPWIGGVLPVLIGVSGEPINALYILIWIIIVQQVESNLVRPVILSHNVGLHPLTVIFSVLFFGHIFGIIGLIVGVPLVGIIKVIIRFIIEFRKHNITETQQPYE